MVSFSSDASPFIFKLSRVLFKTMGTILNQLLQLIFSKIRVQNKANKTVSDFTPYNKLIGPSTDIVVDS